MCFQDSLLCDPNPPGTYYIAPWASTLYNRYLLGLGFYPSDSFTDRFWTEAELARFRFRAYGAQHALQLGYAGVMV